MLNLANHSGDATRKPLRGVDAPAPTMTGHADRNAWAFVETGQNSAQGCGRTKRYRKSIDAPAPTVTGQVRSWTFAGAGAGSQGRTSTNVTPREAATLQTYPLDFVFAGGNGDQCQQIGNAVPPLLAEVFLTALWSEPAADPWADVFAGVQGSA